MLLRQEFVGSSQLASQDRPTTRGIKRKLELLHIERLLQKVHSAFAKSLHGAVPARVPAKGDHWRSTGAVRCRPQQWKGILGSKVEVKEDYIEILRIKIRNTGFDVRSLT